jgi:uncharacterized membrane protein
MTARFTGAVDANGNYIPVVGMDKTTATVGGAAAGAVVGVLVGLAFEEPLWAAFIGALVGAGGGFALAEVSANNASNTNTQNINTLNAITV